MSVWLWLAANTGHAVIVWRAAQRCLPAGTRDERVFAAAAIGIGGLSAALHLAAVTIGLSLTSAVAALAIADLLLVLIAKRACADGSPRPPTAPAVRIAEGIALAVLAGVLLAWIDLASQTADVTGTDAAHYHVPVAVNLAFGAGLFDLPATQHLYPMAGSLLAAWFIVPLATPAILDLVMLLPFVLLWASLAWIFRLAAGHSGIAWTTWLTLALFSTPLFRASSLVSADLWFAAAFAALTAVLMRGWSTREWRPIDLAIGGLALGLLVGVKTSGAAAAVLLVGSYAVFEIGRAIAQRRWRPPFGFRGALLLAATGALALAAGGVWLIRGWVLFGSPIAPAGVHVFDVTIFQGQSLGPTTYLSVFGDLENDPNYDLVLRARWWIRVWLGSWFVPVAALVLLMPVDLLLARGRRDDDVWRARLMLLGIAAAAGGGLVWMLIGAPWTSLEWTKGFALRYALPVVALVPCASLAALLPMSRPWQTALWPQLAAIAALAIAGMAMFAGALDPAVSKYVNVPPLSLAWLAAGAAIVLAGTWLATRGTAAGIALALLPALFASAWTPVIADRARRERDDATAREERQIAALTDSEAPDSAGRHAYLVALLDERAAARTCERRRFFVLSRFDEPLTLQSAVYANQVFYAARDADSASRAGPLGACDYIVSTPAMLETDKGTALVVALSAGRPLREIGSTARFVILGLSGRR